MQRGIFTQLSIGSQILLAILIGMVSQFVVLAGLSSFPSTLEWTVLRQVLNMTMVFLMPPLLLLKWRSEDPLLTWKLIPTKNPHDWVVALLGVTLLLPIGEYISVLFHAWESAPEWWLEQRELQANSESFIEEMLASKAITQAAVFFALVILPPFAEEFFFRGTIQRLLYRSMPSWAAIVLTAVFFSFAHLQIDNAVSIFLLALGMGMIYHRTHKLWMTIAAHMVFNAITYISSIGYFEVPQNHLTIGICAVLGVALILTSKKNFLPWRPLQMESKRE